MIRLFAPPTTNRLLGRTALTAGNLLLHLLLVGLLAVPIGHAVHTALLDRNVIYLVPEEKPGGQEHPLGDAPLNARANAPGEQPAGPVAVAEAPDEDITSLGEVPVISSSDLREVQLPRAETNALTELEVDSAVVRDPSSAAPNYPPLLLQRGVEGSAAVRYVVDTLGSVDTMTYRVVAATHVEFAVAVRRALPYMRFRPALHSGQRVRQLVQQTFRFRVTRRDTLPPDPELPA